MDLARCTSVGFAVVSVVVAVANLAYVKDRGKTFFASPGGRMLLSSSALLGSFMLF